MNPSTLVFTSSQAARYLGVSLATVRRWADAGHLEYYRTPGGQRRFSRDQLEQFVASMHQASTVNDDGNGNRPAPAAA
jgi:excisionase family DNA binding protein